jgi:hypothetical protein
MKGKLFHFHHERNSKPFLLLEIGLLHVRLHSIDGGKKPIGVATLSEETLTPGDIPLLLETVRKILDTESSVRDLAIVINSPVIRHQVIGLPHMNASERQKVLMHEMKHINAADDAPGIISHWTAGKVKEQDITKEYVLCAEMNRSIADNLIAVVGEKKFNLIGFTSHAQAVSSLLKECPLDGNLNVALLETNEREGSITLFHSGIWNMDRHFLIGGSSALAESRTNLGLDAEKLKLEVGRALQYFKQQVRSENINHIFLFGTTKHATDFKQFLETSFRIPVTLLEQQTKTFALGDSAENQEGFLPLYEIAHAVALHAHFDRYISFLPPEWRAEKGIKIRRSALIVAALAYYAFMGGAAYLLNREAAKISVREQAGMQSPLLQGNAEQPAQQLQINRSFAVAAGQSDQWLRNRHRVVAELARELAGAVPPQMRITAMELTEKGDAWQIKLQAEIRSPNGSRSRQLFLGFQDQMQQRSCLQQLTWKEVQVNDSESAQPADAGNPLPGGQNSLTFIMQGQLHYTGLPSRQESKVDPIRG